MPDNLVKMRRKAAATQMEKLRGGDLVSDRETRQMQEKAQGVAEAGLQAQQAALARSQQQMAGGAPVQKGAMAQSQGALSKASADAAVKASGQAQDMAAALTAQRRAEALQLGAEEAENQRRKRAKAVQWAMLGTQIAGQIISLIPGGQIAGAGISSVGAAGANVAADPSAQAAAAGSTGTATTPYQLPS